MALRGLGCPCSNVPGRMIVPPSAAGMGALPKSLGFGRLGLSVFAQPATMSRPTNLSMMAAAPVSIASPSPVAPIAAPVVNLAPQTAANVATAAQLIAGGAQPTPQQAVNIIRTVIPPAPGFRANIPAPTATGKKNTSQLSGLSFGGSQILRQQQLYKGLGTTSTIAKDISIGTTLGSVVPGLGNAIGGAVGAVVGLVEGLFGHKKSIPTVSQADISQAQSWLQQYVQVAGSVVGRNFTSDAINDMLMAMAILNPGFWGRASSSQISAPAVGNFVQEEITRIKYFFQSLAVVPVGGIVTLQDIPSIPGHGKTDMNVTYSFTSPGINAPSYILGAYFAQYFFVMCSIFQPAANCAGMITAPFPQMHCDILDWVRSTTPAWDTPQPNVVTGADVSIAAPVVTQEGNSIVATAVATSLAPTSAAAETQTLAVPNAPPPVTAPSPQLAPVMPASQMPAATQAPGSAIPTYAAPQSTYGTSQVPSMMNQPVTLAPVSLATGQPVQQPSGAAPGLPTVQPSAAGFSTVEMLVLAAIGLPILVGLTSSSKKDRQV
jgi:hypothetical protein